jgi:ribA/ribD-fused uncharacterized protein
MEPVKVTTPPSEIVWNGKTYPDGGFWVDNWFSNMHVCQLPIYHKGLAFNSVEAAYQAAKYTDPLKIKAIQDAPFPQRTKTMTRNWQIETPNWESHRLGVMWSLCCQKWSQPKHKEQLLAHKGEQCEFANWNDAFWAVVISTDGTVKGGQNFLGRIVTEIRERIEQGKDFAQPAWLVPPPKPLEPQLTLL